MYTTTSWGLRNYRRRRRPQHVNRRPGLERNSQGHVSGPDSGRHVVDLVAGWPVFVLRIQNANSGAFPRPCGLGRRSGAGTWCSSPAVTDTVFWTDIEGCRRGSRRASSDRKCGLELQDLASRTGGVHMREKEDPSIEAARVLRLALRAILLSGQDECLYGEKQTEAADSPGTPGRRTLRKHSTGQFPMSFCAD